MDDLALFLATRDPVVVSREWTRAGLEAVLLERPTMSGRQARKATASFAVERAGRMLAEMNNRKER